MRASVSPRPLVVTTGREAARARRVREDVEVVARRRLAAAERHGEDAGVAHRVERSLEVRARGGSTPSGRASR